MTKTELLKLTICDGYPSVSIHLPTACVGPDRRETPIRIRNLLKQAEAGLEEAQVPSSKIHSLLVPIRDYADCGDWLHQSKGLALFSSTNDFHVVETPFSLAERSVIDRRYFVRPLLPVLANAAYYVLVLDQHDIRLLRGNREAIKEVHLPHLPHRREDVVPFRHPRKETQGHTVAGPSHAPSLVSHGGPNIQDEEREQIRHLFLTIANAVRPFVAITPAPVILAGVDYLCEIFRALSVLPLASQTIEGSPKTASNETLRDRAWAIMAERQADLERREAANVRARLGTGLASDHLSEVVPAAIQGRVETLFIRDELLAWGSYEAKSGHVHRSAGPGRDNEELLNLAAIHVLRHGGVVYECTGERVPSQNGVAATFRY
ncbi:MAG: hypothetical protein ACO1SV_24545 [Fimbriimonas sp.]